MFGAGPSPLLCVNTQSPRERRSRGLFYRSLWQVPFDGQLEQPQPQPNSPALPRRTMLRTTAAAPAATAASTRILPQFSVKNAVIAHTSGAP